MAPGAGDVKDYGGRGTAVPVMRSRYRVNSNGCLARSRGAAERRRPELPRPVPRGTVAEVANQSSVGTAVVWHEVSSIGLVFHSSQRPG